MPQLYLILAVVSLLLGKLKDILSAVNISDENKKLIRYGLIGVALYYVFKIIQHTTNKEKALGDVNGSLAIELNNAIYSQAFNLHVPILGDFHVGNGDENAVLLISEKITNITETAKFYKDLYGVDLFTDLVKVLDSEQLATFNANVQRNNNGGVIPGPNDPTIQTFPNSKGIKVGTAMYCKTPKNVNVRNAKDPSKVMYQVNSGTTYYSVFGKGKGYIGDFVKERAVKINDKLYQCYEIDIPYEKQVGVWDMNIGLNGLIVKDFVK